MKNVTKKLLALMLVLALSMAMLTACGDKTPTDGDDPTPTQGAPDDKKEPEDVVEEDPVDLGAIEITIGDWWSAEEPEEPKTQQEEDTLAYRTEIQEKYNFTLKQVGITDWGGMQELFTTSVMADAPAAEMFLLEGAWTAQPLANGLLYDLSTLENLDLTESKWNQNTVEVMTYGDAVYGFSHGRSEPRGGVFWNKRLFQEAGLDGDLLYDLQASGEWTWAKLEELADRLTRDTDNDGTIDTYALASFSSDMFASVLPSNNAKFIGRDDDGNFYNATTEPQFLEASQWIVGLIESGYEMQTPSEDANWDWFISAFHDSQVAMTFAEQYKVGTWADMTDDWGFVLPPKRSADDPYRIYFKDNVMVMPSTHDAETAEKIAFAYNLWTNPTPGYEDETDVWKENFYPVFRDARAVDETLELMHDPSTVVVNDFVNYVYGLETGPDFLWDVFGLNGTPAEKIEELSTKWESLINDANN